ncbi:HAD family acid phosphatase [Arthrobacter woluwensis]|uniref:HAD superfamily, subfamily IIIB (Acid phosphatase) n=1 Tax=Arthrobacter woluwensis TaxID=156980 RepID=A0A1H4K5V9_9MICC|nr:HAD family acid phosphatase [Arthrobacter woluwensis]SEB53931.1 HAD superfamily, subfamily IIIB (Acid phosphatase) [Arthrobacter woluwensis]
MTTSATPRSRHRAFFLGAIALCLAAGAAPAHAATPPSKSQWLSDVTTAMSGSSSYLDSRAQQGGSKLSVVLDIDNTSLETYYSPGTATPQVLEFAQHAKKLGFKVLVATYRSDTAGAKKDLEAAGYSIDGVCGQVTGDSGPAVTKQRCRQQYAAAGYTITANVGNRPTDMQGGNYERGFQLPDYDGGLS